MEIQPDEEIRFDESKGGKIKIILAAIIVVMVVAVGVFVFLSPVEEAIIDDTASISPASNPDILTFSELPKVKYHRELKTNQGIHVEVDLLEGGPAGFYIWNPNGIAQEANNTFTKYSKDITISEDGIHEFWVTNEGTSPVTVRIHVHIIS